MAIIKSLLDNDLYKATMMQAVLHQFPGLSVQYRFKCRNKDIVWTDEMVKRIKDEVRHFCTLQFTKDELDWLGKLRFIKSDYIEFLRIYKPQYEHVNIYTDGTGLNIFITGPWFLTILFEVPVLAIVNEIYFDEMENRADFSSKMLSNYYGEAKNRLLEKIEIAKAHKFLFSDFGTRRRYSTSWQDKVVKTLSENLPRSIFGGTSNMYLAKKYGLVPIGTMAHEWIMAGQALEGVTLAGSQRHMLQAWVNEYRGDLGIALSDTLGTDKFLRDFDMYFAKLYDGVRHDSGDPFAWGHKMIKHYESMKIDPRTKSFVWSDGLDFEKASKLNATFGGSAKCSFGIGTNLTNDFPGVTPLNIVIKLVDVNNRPVAKISDTPSKGMCEDLEFLDYLKKVSLA